MMKQSENKKEVAGAGAGKWRADAIAGLINAVVSVPDGLASGALVGVNPLFGLYASVMGPLVGGLLVSAQLMQVSTTSASAIAAAEVVGGFQGETREQALFALVICIGIFLIIFGLLRLGRLARFISHAVMTGFLSGVAVLLIMDQAIPLTGYTPPGNGIVVRFINLLRSPGAWHEGTLFIGGLALVLSIWLGRTRLRNLAPLLALVIPTVLLAVARWPNVAIIADVSPITRGFPLPALPTPGVLSLDLVFSAMAIALVVMVQGAGVSQSVANPDGKPVNPSRDLLAQGAANVASGLFSGVPVGGSVGQTALNESLGARSRWSVILGGVWMLAIVLIAPGLVSQVPMSVLGALMILSGFSAIRSNEIQSIWQTSMSARVALLVTFAATLLLPVQWAVLTGVLLTVAMYLGTSGTVRLVQWVMEPGKGPLEGPPPANLTARSVTVLNVYGSLHFAGARSLEEQLPVVGDADHALVVLRLRGRNNVGATLIDVLDDYASDLAQKGGRIYLSGVDPYVAAQIERASAAFDRGSILVYRATSSVEDATWHAYADALGALAQPDDLVGGAVMP